METRFQDARVRVQHGRLREHQIASALVQQAGLVVEEASDDDDKTRKIDRWLVRGGVRYGLQIKYRETGDDLLFEVYDRFNGWDAPGNKVGRDVVGGAEFYAVLKSDRQSVVVIPTSRAKSIIRKMELAARQTGWSSNTLYGSTFRYFLNGGKVELKVQRDPGDGRSKMVAYIPSRVFEGEPGVETFRVKLPEFWKMAA